MTPSFSPAEPGAPADVGYAGDRSIYRPARTVTALSRRSRCSPARLVSPVMLFIATVAVMITSDNSSRTSSLVLQTPLRRLSP